MCHSLMFCSIWFFSSLSFHHFTSYSDNVFSWTAFWFLCHYSKQIPPTVPFRGSAQQIYPVYVYPGVKGFFLNTIHKNKISPYFYCLMMTFVSKTVVSILCDTILVWMWVEVLSQCESHIISRRNGDTHRPPTDSYCIFQTAKVPFETSHFCWNVNYTNQQWDKSGTAVGSSCTKQEANSLHCVEYLGKRQWCGCCLYVCLLYQFPMAKWIGKYEVTKGN